MRGADLFRKIDELAGLTPVEAGQPQQKLRGELDHDGVARAMKEAEESRRRFHQMINAGVERALAQDLGKFSG